MPEKLVRDKIPEIIRANGETADIRVAQPDEMPHFLRQKLLEEAREFNGLPSLEELADVLTVVFALCHAHGWSTLALYAASDAKWRSRGGFDDRIILKSD